MLLYGDQSTNGAVAHATIQRIALPDSIYLMYAHKYQYITICKHTQYCYNESSSVLVVIITTLNFWSQHMDYLTEIFSCYFYSLLQKNDPTSGKSSSWPWKSVTSELGHRNLKVWMLWKLEIIWSFTQDLWQLLRTNMLQTHKNFVSNVSGAQRQIGEKGHCWRNISHPLPRQDILGAVWGILLWGDWTFSQSQIPWT